MPDVDIVVTIPAYNEEETIGKVVSDIHDILRKRDYIVVVVSDGSTDMTIKRAREAGAYVHNKIHNGLANTFRVEMAVALKHNPKYIVHIDGDGQYDAKFIPVLLREVKRGYDLVLGSRLRGRIEGMPKSKRLFNEIGTLGIRIMLQANITDATTGFRAFTPSVAMLPIESNFTYTIEQLVRASRAGYRIKSVPVVFRKRTGGDSRLMKGSGHYIAETIRNARRMY